MTDLDWPAEFDRTPPEDRKPYPHGFRVSRSEAFESILSELRTMGAKNVQLDTGAEHQKQNPNKPYANASFDDPGVVVRFEHEGTQYAMPCDTWSNPRDNARAIARTLDAKRALTRYGVETIESEFRRHELPPGDGSMDEAVVAGPGDAPHEILGVSLNASDTEIKAAYREKVKETHPDKSNGNRREYIRVQEAKEVLLR